MQLSSSSSSFIYVLLVVYLLSTFIHTDGYIHISNLSFAFTNNYRPTTGSKFIINQHRYDLRLNLKERNKISNDVEYYNQCNYEEVVSSRRGILQLMAHSANSIMLFTSSCSVRPSSAATAIDKIKVPIQYISALNAYVIQYYLFGERFGAIVDTGSPFLTVPATCSEYNDPYRRYKYKNGCYHPERTYDSGYGNTLEVFSNLQGPVVWRKAGFTFREDLPTESITFGVLGPELLDGPGGVFFGLIKETEHWIRPSFLSQTGYNSFCVDLRPNQQSLILSKQSMIQDDEYIPLVRDLYRRYNAPVVHYTARALSFIVDDLPLQLDKTTGPTYVIFDTGLTGMAVSNELFEGRNLQARKNHEKSLWGSVCVSFMQQSGKIIELSATKPITTSLGEDTQWTRGVKGNIIVIGLAFLDGIALTIDIDDGKLAIAV
jgi:hypothetical protein